MPRYAGRTPLLEILVEASPESALLRLRTLNSAVKEAVDARLFKHIAISAVPPPAGVDELVTFAVSAAHPLPLSWQNGSSEDRARWAAQIALAKSVEMRVQVNTKRDAILHTALAEAFGRGALLIRSFLDAPWDTPVDTVVDVLDMTLPPGRGMLDVTDIAFPTREVVLRIDHAEGYAPPWSISYDAVTPGVDFTVVFTPKPAPMPEVPAKPTGELGLLDRLVSWCMNNPSARPFSTIVGAETLPPSLLNLPDDTEPDEIVEIIQETLRVTYFQQQLDDLLEHYSDSDSDDAIALGLCEEAMDDPTSPAAMEYSSQTRYLTLGEWEREDPRRFEGVMRAQRLLQPEQPEGAGDWDKVQWNVGEHDWPSKGEVQNAGYDPYPSDSEVEGLDGADAAWEDKNSGTE